MATAAVAPETPARQTTRRGIATASFALGMWSLLVFWWYPFGLMVSGVAITLGLVALLLGWQVGKGSESLPFLGVFLGMTSSGLAVGSYRFMQLAFEDIIPSVGPMLSMFKT